MYVRMYVIVSARIFDSGPQSGLAEFQQNASTSEIFFISFLIKMSSENQENIFPSAENEQITRTSGGTEGSKPESTKTVSKTRKTKDRKKVVAGK